MALPTTKLSVFDQSAAGMVNFRVPATTAIAIKPRIAIMMNDLVGCMFERDEDGIQVLWYQWSKRVDALTAGE